MSVQIKPITYEESRLTYFKKQREKAAQAIKILNGETNRTSRRRLDMKIFLVTADYRNPPVTPPYAVQANTKKEAKEYFKNKYTWLKIYKVEEYTDDPNDIKWFW